MKKKLLFIVCFPVLAAVAVAQQNNSVPVKLLRLDSITAFGKPDGNEAMTEIGREGGNILSEDGKVELIFPEGALTKKKKITIQPVNNHAANGRGKAYRMEPSGLQFEKPVTIVFHYSDDETYGTLPELKGIAWQDERGKWEALPEVILDTAAKTITSQIQHFSSYSSFDKIVLKPEQARVKVEKSIRMEIHFAISDPDNDIVLPPSIPAPLWTVNGIPHGNANAGRITTLTTNNAKFTAPVSMPAENPVAVAAQLKGLQITFNKKVFKDPILVSNLLIYDKAYRITMNIWFDNSEDGPCTMRMEDSGAFSIVMEGSRIQIKEIVNQGLRIRINSCYNCPLIWKNRPLTVPINIVGTRRINVTPASLPDNPFTRVQLFLHHSPSSQPFFGSSCPAGGGMPTFLMPVHLPPLIEFEANNEAEQLLTLSELTKGGMKNSSRHGIKIIIKRIEDDE